MEPGDTTINDQTPAPADAPQVDEVDASEQALTEGVEAIAGVLGGATDGAGVGAADDVPNGAPRADGAAPGAADAAGDPAKATLNDAERLNQKEAMLAAFKAATGETTPPNIPSATTTGKEAEAKAQTAPITAPASDTSATPAELKGLRDTFAEEWGEDAAKKLDPLLSLVQQQQEKLKGIDTFVQQQQAAREQAYEREVHGFFDGVLAKIPGRADVYGDSAKGTLSPEIVKTRQLVHFAGVRKLSESIEAAAKNPTMKPLTPEQAMRWADELINGPITETKTQARKQIESTIVRRHQTRTLTPSSAPPTAKARDTSEDLRQAGADAIREALSGS